MSSLHVPDIAKLVWHGGCLQSCQKPAASYLHCEEKQVVSVLALCCTCIQNMMQFGGKRRKKEQREAATLSICPAVCIGTANASRSCNTRYLVQHRSIFGHDCWM